LRFENEGQKATPIIASFQNRVNLNQENFRISGFGCQISAGDGKPIFPEKRSKFLIPGGNGSFSEEENYLKKLNSRKKCADTLKKEKLFFKFCEKIQETPKTQARCE